MKKSDANLQPWEQSYEKIATPLEEFIHEETTSGFILMLSAIIAMILANSVLAHHYEHILHTKVAISIVGIGELRYTLHHWINDGLMALFFLVVGLEIKREVIVGELSDPKAALMPIIAAVGGMAVPALMYYSINMGSPEAAVGWGVPMATDIAFAVGVLVLLGSRVPKTVLTFLVGLAIVDDLGAVVVIALFYTEQIMVNWLYLVIFTLAVLIALNRMGFRKPLPYFLVGIVMWFAMLQSGVHATLAGVIIALTIPVKPKFDHTLFIDYMRNILKGLKETQNKNSDSKKLCIIHDNESRALLQQLENGVHSVESPLQRLEHTMHMPVALFIIPLFALANAGIPIELSTISETLNHPVAFGVMAGLIIGKLIGVAGLTWLAVKIGLGKLPEGMTLNHLIGVGFLAGIGFTMSIFIAELGFAGNSEYLLMAKTGILFASLIAGIIGYLWLRFTSK